MKKIFIMLLIGGFLLTGSLANAFTLGGYTGPIQIKFNNWDMGSTYGLDPLGNVIKLAGPIGGIGGEDSWGILKLTQIYAANSYGLSSSAIGSPLWNDSLSEEITGIFWGVTDFSVVPNPWPSVNIGGIGGFVELYLDNTPDFNPLLGSSGRGGANIYATATDGVPFFSGMFVAGTFMGDGNPANDGWTFANIFNFANNTGQGSFFVDIFSNPGDYSWLFNSNQMKVNMWNPGFDDLGNPVPNRDFYAQFVSNPYIQIGPTDDWLVTSFDPVRGGAVPVPTTLLLFGSGLIGLVGVARMRFLKK